MIIMTREMVPRILPPLMTPEAPDELESLHFSYSVLVRKANPQVCSASAGDPPEKHLA
eukprot:COSAG01_NODE_3611_length_5872_cov_7.051793_2_plen_58_part_00